MVDVEFFIEYGEVNCYCILEVIGKGSYGVVCFVVDMLMGEKVVIKKINDIFEYVLDVICIFREIKFLCLLWYFDIVEVKYIMFL